MNKVAWITGASKGIGLAIAYKMAEEGYHLVLTSRHMSDLEEVKTQIEAQFTIDILIADADVTSLTRQNEIIDLIEQKWGRLDVLVANAGVGHFAPIDQMSEGQWNQTISVNLTGVFNSVKASVELLKESKGYIITMASLAGTNFFEQGAAYNASKFGLVGFSQAIMLDLRKYDIKVTTIMPGSVATHFNGNIPSDKDNWKIQPEDLGVMVIDLLRMNPRTLPSKIEVRPSFPHKRKK